MTVSDSWSLNPMPGQRWLVAVGNSENGATEIVEVVQTTNNMGRIRVLRTVTAYVRDTDFLREIEED